MKIVIIIFSIFSSIISYAQSKKEQIETLILRVDSLNNVLRAERNISNQNIINLNSKISSLENQIKILNTRIDERDIEVKLLKEGNSEKDKVIQRKTDEINGLHQTLSALRDSILNTSKILDTVIWEIPDSINWNQSEFNLKLTLPLFKFNPPRENILSSRDNKIILSYDYNYTYVFDEDTGSPHFYTEQDAINYYSKDLIDIELSENEGFVIVGRNSTNQLVIIKGLYDELASMQGRDEGEPMWLWSNTLIIKITADEADKDEFNYISRLLISNFSTRSIVYKY
jgi:hypothetical protein